MQQTISQEGLYHAILSASDRNSSQQFGLDKIKKRDNIKKSWEILQMYFTTVLNTSSKEEY